MNRKWPRQQGKIQRYRPKRQDSKAKGGPLAIAHCLASPTAAIRPLIDAVLSAFLPTSSFVFDLPLALASRRALPPTRLLLRCASSSLLHRHLQTRRRSGTRQTAAQAWQTAKKSTNDRLKNRRLPHPFHLVCSLSFLFFVCVDSLRPLAPPIASILGGASPLLALTTGPSIERLGA